MRYEDLKVESLKVLCRERGLKLESKGKKYNKTQLIQNIREDNEGWSDAEHAEGRDCERFLKCTVDDSKDRIEKEPDPVEKPGSKKEDKEEREKEKSEEDDERLAFAETFKQIEKKYHKRKSMDVYRRNLKVGAYVIFIDVFETPAGTFAKKLRKAKVILVDFEAETVRLQMFYGQELDVAFSELLYIKPNERARFPFDLVKFMRRKYSKNWKEREEYKQKNGQFSGENVTGKDVRSQEGI